ncbi:hypothetical protein AGABI2DRAFT_137101 [Agaricus bisporus var. bisporus H97]|uniref:hypothetical protein n=1 Tax=Agaricus bisporus var. bisporus (strain H97 / ATCC MYA-4626 / FGSC 10389) TaxID=936046 RepID=UPI00029F52BF|nr:hypothetical protein AGABI2DRAFT_137101 [Agaricus bisporus var. bisporus H97]EKV45578.1 hypothetical protein AGABI2DRAFT_137101 [Agaricus bisporus var. bisporus H97]
MVRLRGVHWFRSALTPSALMGNYNLSSGYVVACLWLSVWRDSGSPTASNYVARMNRMNLWYESIQLPPAGIEAR